MGAQPYLKDPGCTVSIRVIDSHHRVLFSRSSHTAAMEGVAYALASVLPPNQQLFLTEWTMGASDGLVDLQILDLSGHRPVDRLTLKAGIDGGFDWSVKDHILTVSASLYPDGNPQFTAEQLDEIRSQGGEGAIRDKMQAETVRIRFDPATKQPSATGTTQQIALFNAMAKDWKANQPTVVDGKLQLSSWKTFWLYGLQSSTPGISICAPALGFTATALSSDVSARFTAQFLDVMTRSVFGHGVGNWETSGGIIDIPSGYSTPVVIHATNGFPIVPWGACGGMPRALDVIVRADIDGHETKLPVRHVEWQMITYFPGTPPASLLSRIEPEGAAGEGSSGSN